MNEVIGSLYFIVGLFVTGLFMAEYGRDVQKGEEKFDGGLALVMMTVGFIFWPFAVGLRVGGRLLR